MSSIARRLLIGLALAALLPAIAWAGTLCGTVTDRTTNAPIAHAGIFIRTPSGAYTGLNGATDANGEFCIVNVPAGTYDIEVRVDDFQVGYLRGVVVTGSATGVSIGADPTIASLAPPSPNPARVSSLLRWRLPAPSAVELVILDARGRLVRGFSASLPAGEHSQSWDLRDASGRAVPAGLYFVRLEAGGRCLVRSLIRIR
jgi:hypothetical protein